MGDGDRTAAVSDWGDCCSTTKGTLSITWNPHDGWVVLTDEDAVAEIKRYAASLGDDVPEVDGSSWTAGP
jgi:hypothetical protein